MPLPEPTDALVLLLVQLPPVGRQSSAVVSPTHTVGVPVIDPGCGFTVIVVNALQPVVGTV
jgi:hypothetical protein